MSNASVAKKKKNQGWIPGLGKMSLTKILIESKFKVNKAVALNNPSKVILLEFETRAVVFSNPSKATLSGFKASKEVVLHNPSKAILSGFKASKEVVLNNPSKAILSGFKVNKEVVFKSPSKLLHRRPRKVDLCLAKRKILVKVGQLATLP